MPHYESPPMAPAIVAKTTATAPTYEEIEAISNTVYTSKTSQTSLDASYELTKSILNSIGFDGLSSYGLLDSVKKAAADKKNGARREGAMFILGAVLELFPPKQPITEVLFLRQRPEFVTIALDALADKGSTVREGAQYALDAIFNVLKPEALPIGLLPILIEYLGKPTGKWQGTVGGYNMIMKMSDKAKIGTGSAEEEKTKDVLREIMGKRLEGLIPTVEAGMHDLKAEVSKAAIKTMKSITTLLQNDDVEPRIPLLIKSMEHPSAEALAKAIHALSQTTFVAVVTSPVLALLTPLLERSLNNPTTSQEVLRQTVIVVENLTKLVHDPTEARAFLPKLQPGVKSVKDRASLPEVREIATRAWNTMLKAMGDQDGNIASAITRTLPEDIVSTIQQRIQASGSENKDFAGQGELCKLAIVFSSELAAEDVNQREIERISLCIEPYLSDVLGVETAGKVAEQVQNHYQEEDNRRFGGPIREDDGEVEIVNATFSLGYGGMLLLSHTNLRLLKGHRYGLCGRNGAGKSTLMRSIAENKLEGFPPPEEVKTCFVEHNQGEDADLSILEYVSRDPRFASETRERISSTLEEVGFDAGPDGRQSHKVGSLSGGWKMKLALARAMLMRADVLLLDEPTNHLDTGNVKWLQEYLKKHTEITSLIVSHDSGFLDEVCTDIYHYEPGKKLKCYRGNLSEFVKIRPEAKSYYTLSATNAGFRFPPPGILSGIKSQTKAILRMKNCNFTYPGASKPSLTDVSCQLSLSSRVAIIGPNGAGKSTLIKVLTGEVVPQTGHVDKHPNLRIGYIKQHALEHVEMHMEKTPNQYLQWRYANGDDREIHMKQTRIMTPEEKEQMGKYLRLGLGAEGQIEALIGRQKYKKTYQYEVKWVNKLPKHNSMVSKETLLEHGFHKLVQEFDDHESSREGLGYRILEPKVISQHFKDIGLDPDIADHNQISGLSGGQKVKVVLAGAAWANPHLLVLDEPTNFLDRDSIGGLAVAIRDYKGGVVMISHNEEFVSALCPEQWHVNEGRLVQKGHLAVLADRFEDGGSSGATPLSSAPVSNVASASASAVNSDAEGEGELKFRAKKKKKMTRKELKDREVRRRLRHIEWLNSPKGTPHPPDTDDEA